MDHAVESLDNLRPGDCIVCFSKNDIYSISRQIEARGQECAVIYGSLPPGESRSVTCQDFNQSSWGKLQLVCKCNEKTFTNADLNPAFVRFCVKRLMLCDLQALSCPRPRSSMTLKTPARSWLQLMLSAWALTCKHHHISWINALNHFRLLFCTSLTPTSEMMSFYSIVTSQWSAKTNGRNDHLTGWQRDKPSKRFEKKYPVFCHILTSALDRLLLSPGV